MKAYIGIVIVVILIAVVVAWRRRQPSGGGCGTQTDCPAGQLCENGKCVEQPKPPTVKSEVYRVDFGTYGLTPSAVNSVVNEFAGLATLGQLQDAQQNGAQWCYAGWVYGGQDAKGEKISDLAYYPMQSAVGGCGNKAGVIATSQQMAASGMHVYGPKPAEGKYATCHSGLRDAICIQPWFVPESGDSDPAKWSRYD